MKSFLPKDKVFIIAEAGVNHNGKLTLAKKLVDAAKQAGADAVKFQTFKTENLVSGQAPLAVYQKNNKQNRAKNQRELIKALELPFGEFIKLKNHCDRKKILFLSTPFDFESADFLEKLGISFYKIPSGDIDNLPFLQHIAQKRIPIILSTGMSYLKEVKEAVNAIYKTGNRDLALLHCTTEYPTPFHEVNLKAIDTLKKIFNVPVGYSDHTLGIEVAVAAAARGSRIIEKHITLDHNMKGPDHKASLEPSQFQAMVGSIRHIEAALGNGIKAPTASEKKNIPVARKSLVALERIEKGEKTTYRKISFKRPGSGISPKELHRVIGRTAKVSIPKDHLILWKDLL